MGQDEVAGGVVKIVELVGSSDASFSDAVRNAVKTASRTLRNIQGVDVIASSASVGADGELTLYKVNCKIAFLIEEHGSRPSQSAASSRGQGSEAARADTTRPTDEPPAGITAERISSVEDGENE